METMYQRSRIQEESMLYERLKHTGELPIVGVNTFEAPEGAAEEGGAVPLMRSSDDEKRHQLEALRAFHARNVDRAPAELERLQHAAREASNVFEVLMDAVRVCSLGQITSALFEVGGQYRRSM
jgi:methylmalonyl-CoA mutase